MSVFFSSFPEPSSKTRIFFIRNCSYKQVVELTRDEKTQADALSVVLSLQYFSSFHARAMAEESGFALLKRILLSRECKIGYHTLKVFSTCYF